MNVRSPFSAVCYFATAVSLATTGCNSDRARSTAYSEYQAASANGDLVAARVALLRLVAAEDGVADYWLALGGVQLQLGAHADAYYAFTRADELDRGNPQILGVLTRLAVLGGQLSIAEKHAKNLSLVAPDDPSVKLAFGYVALQRGDFELADKYADQLLAASPLDPAATLLKARVLVGRRLPDEAAQLLEAQLRSKPDDISSLRALILLRKRGGEWSKVAGLAMQMAEIRPAATEYVLLAVEAAFRANDIEQATRISQRYLQPNSPSDVVAKVLEAWADRWKSREAIDEVRRLSRTAGAQQLLAYATFFNEAGAPEETARLLGATPRLPIAGGNISANALIATSMALRGQIAPAKRILDAVLEKEPDHVSALRGRVNLNIKVGVARAAVKDAQRLVTITPSSVRDRFLLVRAYAAAADRRQVDRTLWNAFHDIPANEDLYERLRTHVQQTAGPDAAKAVDAEFQQQQETQLAREFF